MIENGEVEAQLGWRYNLGVMVQSKFAFLSPIARIKMWFKLLFFRFFPKFASNHYQKQVRKKGQAKLKWLQERGYTERYKQYKAQLARQADNLPDSTGQDQQQQKDRQVNPWAIALRQANNLRQHSAQRPRQLTRQQRHELRQQGRNGQYSESFRAAFKTLSEAGYTAAVAFLDSVETDENHLEIDVVRHFYYVRQSRFSKPETSSEQENELFLRAFQYEYTFVQGAEKQAHLSAELVSELHKKISMDQMVYMQNTN